MLNGKHSTIHRDAIPLRKVPPELFEWLSSPEIGLHICKLKTEQNIIIDNV